jgi:hypothetical protein
MFICEICDFITDRQSHYNLHLTSIKHNKALEEGLNLYLCEGCKKKYTTRFGLYKHKNKCSVMIKKALKEMKRQKNNKPVETPPPPIELKPETKPKRSRKKPVETSPPPQPIETKPETKPKRSRKKPVITPPQLVETTPEPIIENTIVENVINNHNQVDNRVINIINTFSPNTTEYRNTLVKKFLNEKCGNAINLLDFCKDINFDCDYHKRVYHPRDQSGNPTNIYMGYVNETSKIFSKKLEETPLEERPLHCFPGEDVRQKIYHVRHENEWIEENEIDVMKSAYQVTDKIITYKSLIDLYEKAIKDLDEYIKNNKNITPEQTLLLNNVLKKFSNLDISSDINWMILENITKDVEYTTHQLKLFDVQNTIDRQIENL